MVKIFTAYAPNRLVLNQHSVTCALGKGGVVSSSEKREGDLASPIGRWPMRRVFYRPDRLKCPKTVLPTQALLPDDGWCDDPNHALYNQFIKKPFSASHETLWRKDHVYDVIVELGYNDAPIVPHRGSAIFLHLARPDFSGTEGCVAIELAAMLELLASAEAQSFIAISA